MIPIYIGSICIFGQEDILTQVGAVLPSGEVNYFTLDTSKGRTYTFSYLERHDTVKALLFLQAHTVRMATDFYKVAEKLNFSESALDLILLLNKGNEIVSLPQ